MNAFEFHCPTRIICGEHALHKLPVILVEMSVTKPLVVTDANLVALGITDHAIHRLTEAGFPFAFYDQVPPDSSLSVVNDVAAIYEQEGCDGFIAFGGGSVIDTTKGAAASISVGNRDIAELQGAEILQNDLDPLIAIPTTAGTGSEVTLVAVIADEEAHEKLSYTSYKLVPHVAFLDPLLTASLPPKLTATTGVDALTHAIEAYTSIQKNPVSDALARQAIALISENLVRSCEEPGDLDVRTSLALGSLLAGASFSNAMVGIVHAIGHSLGGICHIPHGQAMMILLPYCVRFNLERGHHAGLYGELLRALRPDLDKSSLTAEERDILFSAALFELNQYLHDHYDVPITLSQLGVERDILPKVARQARYDGAALYNKHEVTEEIALHILEEAY